jgi:hypothetical protein
MRVRRDVVRGARLFASIACECGGVYNCAVQSRVPATPATLVQQPANLLVERLWRPAMPAVQGTRAQGTALSQVRLELVN